MEIAINSTKRLQIVVSCKQAKTAIKTTPQFKFFPDNLKPYFTFYATFLKTSQLYANIKPTNNKNSKMQVKQSNISTLHYKFRMLHRIIEENTIARCRYAKGNLPQTDIRRSLLAEILLLQEIHLVMDETREPQKGEAATETD